MIFHDATYTLLADIGESDDDDEDGGDGKSEKSGTRSGNVSEDDWTDESNSVIRFVLMLAFCPCAGWPHFRRES